MTTNDPEIADRVRVVGAHGSSTKYIHDVIGVNSRLDTVQAVVLLFSAPVSAALEDADPTR